MHSRIVAATLLAGALALLLAAHGAAAEPPKFVRGGLLLHGSAAGPVEVRDQGGWRALPTSSLGAGRRLASFDWSRATEYRFRVAGDERSLRAPARPAPVRVGTIRLEDVSQAAAAGTWPDAVVRFAPDSRRLAIGTFGGRLRVVNALSGHVLHQRQVAEGMVKQLAWSPDGDRLYYGEQSPDGALVALDAAPGEDATYRTLWSLPASRWLGTSRPPADDRYGVYTLPGIFDLRVADDGRIFAAAVHGAPDDGRPRNRCTLLCLSPDGEVVWRLPPSGVLPLTVRHFAADGAGDRLLFLPEQTQEPEADQALHAGTLYLLDGRTGEVSDAVHLEPLDPWFDRVQSWDSVALTADGGRAAVGLHDGRAFLYDVAGGRLKSMRTFRLGVPLPLDVPIGAPCSYTRFLGGELFLQTQNTLIPSASGQAANRPPAPHRGANTLTVADRDGELLWRYRGPFSLSGHWSDADGRWLVVTCRERPGARQRGSFGLLVFDRRQAGGGSDRLVYHYPTAGPVIFHADISPDGRLIAVVETPTATPDGLELYGTYQVHVVH